MASAPASSTELIDLVRKSGLASERLDVWLRDNPALPDRIQNTAAKLIEDGLLTPFHAKHMLTGKYKGFVIGQYKVLDQIGAGGMGVVFQAEHMTMKRQVAIKVLPGDKSSDEESLQRFYREARIVAALDHPNVVHAYDIDQSGDLHFMVMEYIEGESLEQLVRRKGPLPVHEAANYIAQSARGLQHAHERGLIHRDIKPGNLLLDKSGTIKVLDMGLARFFEESSTITAELCNGSVIGTADYMAPEQAVNSHDVDIRADIYSLGVTLYTLLTGKPPFADANVTQKLLAHHMREPVSVQSTRPEIPDEIADIVMKMMAKQPEDRFQTPGEVAAALAPWSMPITVEDITSISNAQTEKNEKTIVVDRYKRKAKVPAKRRWVVPAVVSSALLVVGIIVAVAASGGKKPDEKPVAKEMVPETPKQTAVKPPTTPIVEKPRIGELGQFFTNGDQIERLALSPDERMLVGGSRSGNLKFWDFQSRKLLHETKAHNGTIWFVAFHPTGKLMVSSGQDGAIKVWNTDNWKEEKKFTGPKGAVWSTVFSPDGTQLFSGGDDGVGRIWSLEAGTLVRALEKHEKSINWVAWSPDGKFVYTAGTEGSLRGWDPATGIMKFDIKDKRFSMLTVSSNSSLLLASTDGPALTLFNAKDGKKLRPFVDDKLSVQWNAMFSKDASLAVSSGSENDVRVWDVATGTVFYTLKGHSDRVPGCVITGDGRRVATSSIDATVRLWGVPPR